MDISSDCDCGADPGTDLTYQIPDASAVTSSSYPSLCSDVCTPVALDAYTFAIQCDMTARGNGSVAIAAAVYDAPGGTAKCPKPGGGTFLFCSWGNDASGTSSSANYYCGWDDSWNSRDLVEVDLIGGNQADKLFFWHDVFDMDAYSTTDLTGRIFGGVGDDKLQGSRSTDSYYLDVISGNDDDDIICLQDGDDVGMGGADDDYICGDDDDDTISGGGGADTECGGLGTNTLTGEADGDYLDYGAGGTEDGGIGNDQCENYGTGDATNCEGVFSPNTCP